MLPFKVRQFHMGKLHYLLLPKMTDAQMRVISKRLARARCAVELEGSISARSGEGAIRIDRSGVCRSTVDVSDLLLPAVPDLLAPEKDRIPIEELESLYLATDGSGRTGMVRFSTRAESCSLWDYMRASDSCALSPDEHAVVSFLLKHASGACEVLTDFPEEDSAVRRVGRRRYFDSKVDPATAAATLRVAGERFSRNSYLPRDGVVNFTGLEMPSSAEWREFFAGLGEWCYFAPE